MTETILNKHNYAMILEKSELASGAKKYRYFLASLFLLVCLMSLLVSIKSQEVPTQNQADETHSNENPISLAVIKEYSEILGVLLEAGVVVLLWKTVKDFAELAKVSKLQTEVRFRPWVGPSGGFELLRDEQDKKQYSIAMKNFGEVPATNVVVSCIVSDTKPDKSNSMAQGNENNQFHLGPLLPGMEKRYWVFLDNERYRKTIDGTSNVFIFLYFSYVFPGGKSGYGMISQLDSKTSNFIHREMWID
jgi:hypothetical protein